MKVLSLFCDMVRPNILDFENCKKNSFEYLIKSIGGTYFTNCFSQGPDTGRSMGCFWSGFVPEDNGCNTRARYPKFYLEKKSFLDELTELGYEFHFFTNPNEKILGCLPPAYEDIGHHNPDLDFCSFLKAIDMSKENIFVHLALTDFHWALDDYGANEFGVYNGLRVLKDSIENLENIVHIESFDYVFIFSDHGFKFDREFKSQDKIYLLNRDRSNVMMFIHKKGERDFIYNNKLCSLIDVYPTIMEIVGKDYSGYANSLFSSMEADFIVCEEHGSFLPEVNQKLEYWALVKKDVIYLRSYYQYVRDDGDSFDMDQKEFDELLYTHSKSFREVYKQLKILDLYKVMATDKSFYTNGEPRYIVNNHDYLKRLTGKIKRTIWAISTSCSKEGM